MLKKFGSFVVLMLITLFAVPAHAASGPLGRVGTDVVEIVAYAIAAALSVLFGRLILAIERKFKVDVPDPWEVYVMAWVNKGIDYAEEQAHKVMKRATDKGDALIPDKLELAANFVLEMADDKKLTAKGKEWVKKQIEARLQEKRAVAPTATVEGK